MFLLSKLKNKLNLLNSMDVRLQKIQEALGRVELRILAENNAAEIQKNEFRVFSQWGEDGIIQKLIRHIKIEKEIFVEFDVNAFLGGSVACLKPGGLMIISVPSADSFSQYVQNFWLDMPPHHLTRWTDMALTNVASQYGLELRTIHHEKLQDAHREFYSATIFSTALSGFFKKQYRTVNLSFSARLMGKISAIFGKVFSKGLVSDDLLPRGISVVAVYQKPNTG